MARELTPHDLDQLLGAYALDALDDGEERAQVETHLERFPEARDEVAELREVAALLASGAQSAPPDGLWERIEAALEAEPPRLVLPFPSEHARSRRGIGIRVAAAVAAVSAAAAAISAVVISGAMSRQEDRLAIVEAQVGDAGTRRAAMAAMTDPDARMAYLEPVGDEARGANATVVAMPGGDAFLMAEHLPTLGAGRTYQLWAMTGDHDAPTLLSTAILGRRVDVVSFHAPDGSLGFLITDEAAPGATVPVRPKVLAGEFA